MPLYEQASLVDLADVTNLPGGISIVRFAWETRKGTGDHGNAPAAIYAEVRDINRIVAEEQAKPQPRIVYALADRLPRWFVLRRDTAAGDPLTATPWEFIDVSRAMNLAILAGPDDMGDAAETVTPDMLYRFTRFDEGDFRAFTSNRLVTRPVMVEASWRDFDLEALAPLLEAHPWVGRIFYNKNPHSSPTLAFTVTLPQDVADRGFFNAGKGLSGHSLELALVVSAYWQDRTDTDTDFVLGHDPLGIAAAARPQSLDDPDEDDHLPPSATLTAKYESSQWAFSGW